VRAYMSMWVSMLSLAGKQASHVCVAQAWEPGVRRGCFSRTVWLTMLNCMTSCTRSQLRGHY